MANNQQLLLGEGAGSAPAVYIEDVFSTYLYTGTGATQTITNGIDLSTKGGLVWVKSRAGSVDDHILVDTARGTSSGIRSNSINAASGSGGFTSFNIDGFSFGSSFTVRNDPSNTYASWTFRKQPKFFDVVTWTGDGIANRLISHSLTSTPGFIVVKRTDATADWKAHDASTGFQLCLNLTDAANSTASLAGGYPGLGTSTTFRLFAQSGSLDAVNASSGTYVAYVFASNAGGFGLAGTDNVISCGTYTGNGSSTGPTVTLGYEPQWVMVKRTDSTGDWLILDIMRGIPNTPGVAAGSAYLFANSSNAEDSAFAPFAALSATGFSLLTSNAQINDSGGTYIYIAIRRGPMKVPTDATKVFEPVAFTGNNTSNTSRGTVVTTDLAIISDTNNVAPQNTYNQAFFDRLRGQGVNLTSSNTDAEVSGWGGTYFALDQQKGWRNLSNTTYLNNSAINYVTYNLQRAPGFFDEVCYTGTGSATTFSHNLSAVPEMMIVKIRTPNAYNWYVYHNALGNDKYAELNLTRIPQTSTNVWNDLAPTASVFNLGTNAGVNESGSKFVNYLFATCAGVSKVGTYTGTAAAQVINCGFTSGARFVLIKRTDSTGDWYVWDSARGIVAGNDPYLLLNSAAAEVTGTDYIDTASTGFEISSTAPAAINASAGTFIFLAIA